MAERGNQIERFALLLMADAKLTDAGLSLKRAGFSKDDAQIAKMRTDVAHALQTLQDSVYDGILANDSGR